MIEPNGPWGLDPEKQTDKLRIMICLSDGCGKTAQEISDDIGITKERVIRLLNSPQGLVSKFSLEISREALPDDPNKKITKFKWTTHLRPCPWCNQSPVVLCTVKKHRVECKCGMRTGPHGLREDAIRQWNWRFGE